MDLGTGTSTAETMKVLLIEEVASILRCSLADVLAEIESGRLKAF
jgi:hypothetical protein